MMLAKLNAGLNYRRFSRGGFFAIQLAADLVWRYTYKGFYYVWLF